VHRPLVYLRPARRNASAAVELSRPVSVRVCHKTGAGIISKRLDGSSWFLAWRLPSTYLTLCCKEIQVSPKIMVYFFILSSGLRKFRHARHVGRRNVLSTELHNGGRLA